jgi:hypothetical protein
MRFGGIVSTKRDSVAEGPVVGVCLGDGVVRVRLFGEGVVGGWEIVVVDLVALLRLGIGGLVSGWFGGVGSVSDSIVVCDCAIAVLGVLNRFWDSLLLCRNCCSFP